MGSRSNSATSTTSNFYDNRQVNDAGGGVIGTGNVITTSDSGAIQSAQTIAIKAIETARDSSSDAVTAARAVTERSIDTSQYFGGRAFDLATKSAVQSASSSGEAIGLARDAVAEVKSAYQAAADSGSGNKTLIYVGIAAVAAIGLAIALRK